MPKRLAITIAGAVSLGSYEAGVLYEICEALRQHNTDPATTDAEKIHIDVLTGASAGGMTATIAAQKLLFEASSLQGSQTNCFYQPWVAEVSIDGLLALKGEEKRTHSILSSDLVQDIACRHITDRYASHLDVPRERHPAAADVIYLGLALANLDGVNYGLSLQPPQPNGSLKQFIYTRYQDELKIDLHADASDGDDTLATWEKLRDAAVSCGAFAFAFRPVDLIRRGIDYADKHLVSKLGATECFTYTDGGTFQNEPLGLAKDLVNGIDHHQDADSRFYLFISPHGLDASSKGDFHEADADFVTTGITLAMAAFNQARFHDWIRAEDVNAEVDLLNSRADALKASIEKPAADPGHLDFHTLQPAAAALLAVLFPNDLGPTGERRPDAWQRLQQQYQTEYDDLTTSTGQEAADTWLDTVLTFETAAQLGPKEEMAIYGITADDGELASFELCAFAGFFDRRYRDHDYNVGRDKAQAFLRNPGGLGPIRCQLGPIPPIDDSLKGLKLEKMDRHVRESVCKRLSDRAHEIMLELKIGGHDLIGAGIRTAIDAAFITPQLHKLLKL